MQVGFVVLAGLACKNAILIVEFARDRQLEGASRTDAAVEAARAGDLPQVSWIMPHRGVSEHPPDAIPPGQAFTAKMINAAMKGEEVPLPPAALEWVYSKDAAAATVLALQTFIVIEKPSELKLVLEESKALDVKPGLGVRMRLASLGAGLFGRRYASVPI